MTNPADTALIPPPEVVREIAPTGVLRVAINFGNAVLAQRDPVTQQPRGVSIDLSYALGRQLGVPVELVAFDAAGKVTEALAAGLWDLAFLAVDPRRSEDMMFSAPYVMIEGTYLVRADSRFKEIDDLDADGVRIAVGAGAAYELHLTRTIERAQIIRKPTAAEAFESFRGDGLDAIAGVRQVLEAFARRQGGLRILEGSFMSISQALAVPKKRVASAAYLSLFIEARKADGSVAESLARSGQTRATLAP